MGRHFAWQIPVVAAALILSGCSSNSSDSGSDASTSSATSGASATSSEAAAPNPLTENVGDEYKA